jgi:hypothetical protein
MATKTAVVRKYKILAGSDLPGGGRWLTVRVKVGRFVNLYTLTAEPDGFGLSVEWAHLTDPRRSYTVTVDHRGEATACDCKARRNCKHKDLTEVLVRTGDLPAV